MFGIFDDTVSTDLRDVAMRKREYRRGLYGYLKKEVLKELDIEILGIEQI